MNFSFFEHFGGVSLFGKRQDVSAWDFEPRTRFRTYRIRARVGLRSVQGFIFNAGWANAEKNR